MRIAITDWSGSVSPVYDEAEQVRIMDSNLQSDRVIPLRGLGPGARAEVLREAGVIVLLCGAISPFARRVLAMHEIEVQAWLRGDVNQVLQAWREGRLDRDELILPGCRHLRDTDRREP